MEFKDWINAILLAVTVIATIIGPITAVYVSRLGEDRREKRRRQYNILHSLMRTRAFTLHNDHVAALNLVQLEFYGQEKIDLAFRHYMAHLNTPVPSGGEEPLRGFVDDRDDRFYSLVREIAAELGITFDKSDLKRLAYAPKGWGNNEAQQQAILARTLELLDGRRPLPVAQFRVSSVNSKFPEPPATIDDK